MKTKNLKTSKCSNNEDKKHKIKTKNKKIQIKKKTKNNYYNKSRR